MAPSVSKLCDILTSLAVEPVAFFSFLALAFYQVVTQVGMYRLICYKLYHFANPEINCDHLAANTTTTNGIHVENQVQKAAAIWSIAMNLSYMLPAVFADIFLGALGDRHGRKINIMLGITGLMIALFPYTVALTFPASLPLYVLLIGQVVSGFTGFISIVLISSFAYLADTVVDREALTIRMSFFQVAVDLAAIVGSLLVSASTKWMTQPQMVVMCELVLTFGFFVCLIRVKQVPPTVMRRNMLEKREKAKLAKGGQQIAMAAVTPQAASTVQSAVFQPTARRCSLAEIKTVLATVSTLMKEVWVTYRKPRPGHVRAYLIITAAIVFLHMTAELGIRLSVFTLFVQKAPLSWDQEMIGYFRTFTGGTRLIGLFTGAIILKRWLHFSDSTIVLVSLGSTTCELILFAFSTKTWMVFLASAMGCFATLINPCIKSFIAKLVEPEEVGKSYTAFGIATNIAVLCASGIYNSVYAATVDFYPGFVFLVGSAFVILTSALFFWLHIDYHRQYGSNWACWGNQQTDHKS